MTVISDRHKHVFVHLHKCGGTSIEGVYSAAKDPLNVVLGGDADGESLNLIWGRRYGIHKHSTALELKAFLGRDWNSYWTYSTVRNPKSVYESFYKWMDKIVANFCQQRGISKQSFLVSVRNGSFTEKPPFFDYEAFYPFVNCHSFGDFVVRFTNKSTLGSFYDRLSDGTSLLVDQVFKLEHTGEIWSALSARLGSTVEGTHLNSGSKINEFEWTGAAVASVNRVHEEDFRVFDYSPLCPS